MVDFPRLQRWNALVSESASACQYNFDLFWTLVDAGGQNAGEGSGEILRTPVAAAVSAAKKHQFCQPSCARYRAKFAGDTPATKVTLACGCGSVWPLIGITSHGSPITDHRKFCSGENSYGLGGGVGRGLGVGANLGVGVGLGVGVAVAVPVAVAVGVAVGVAVAVAVEVGVGVAVGPHAEGVPVAVGVGLGVGVGDGVPIAAAISTRPQPYTLFGGPAAPHCTEEINTAELFKASRLEVI